MSKRKKYSPEYKREAVQLVLKLGYTYNQIAKKIGINPAMLSRWVREAEAGSHTSFPGTDNPRDEEVARLKRELVRVTKEREFLKDAAVYFAKGSSSGTR